MNDRACDNIFVQNIESHKPDNSASLDTLHHQWNEGWGTLLIHHMAVVKPML